MTLSGPEAAAFRPGVRLGLDWGRARIGVAACDRDGTLCYPVTTVPATDRPLDHIVALVDEYEPIEVVLGMPTDLRGEAGLAAQAMAEVGDALSAALAVPVRVVDERMSSASAHRQLAAAGRSTRSRRSVIDQAAAVAILESAVRTERLTGVPAGRLVRPETKGEQ